jgi:hypothetical protein
MSDAAMSQADLCAALNVPVDEIRKRRKRLLVEGVDFEQRGAEIFYSSQGVETIRASLHLPPVTARPEANPAPPAPAAEMPPAQPATTQPAPIKTAAEPATPGPVTLIVHRLVTNTHIVECHLQGTDPADRANIVRLRTKDSSKFSRGMAVPAVLDHAPDLYVLAGREPRWKGQF